MHPGDSSSHDESSEGDIVVNVSGSTDDDDSKSQQSDDDSKSQPSDDDSRSQPSDDDKSEQSDDDKSEQSDDDTSDYTDATDNSDATYSDSGSGDDDESEDEQEKAVDKFVKYLRQYLAANIDRVNGAYDSDAGWEVWLHVELFLFIHQQGETRFIREERYVGPKGKKKRLKADFSIGFGLPGNQWVPVEIKCESMKQSGAAFGRAAELDLNKVKDVKGGALVIAVSLTNGAKEVILRGADHSVLLQGPDNSVRLSYTYSTSS